MKPISPSSLPAEAIDVAVIDGVFVLSIIGRVDSNNAQKIEAAIIGHLGSGLDRLVFDLSQLDYISSAGLRVLLITAKKMRQFGGRFALACLRPQIAEVMEVSGFTSIIPCAATVPDALILVSPN